MRYKIEVIESGHGYPHIFINGRDVGWGPIKECEASARELRADDEKAKVVYELAQEDSTGKERT